MSAQQPLKVVHLGMRTPVYPTQSGNSEFNQRWLWAYIPALLCVYVSLSVWRTMQPSSSFTFWMFVMLVPLGTAYYAAQQKQGCLTAGLVAAGSAWICDIILQGIIDA